MAENATPSQTTQWRDGVEIRSLWDTVGIYRRGASALAQEIAELRAEVLRLDGALRASHAERGVEMIEVELDLDEHLPDLVRAIVAAELMGKLSVKTLEDVRLVASELAAGSVRRSAGAPDGQAVLRVEQSESALRVEVQDLVAEQGEAARFPDGVEPLSLVERLSTRWGTEVTAAGRRTVWAQLAYS